VRTRVGYAGGTLHAPTYHRLGDHTETIEVDYDPERLSYEDLLAVFFSSHTPTRPAHSVQYRSAIFYRTPEERTTAEDMLARMQSTFGTLYTDIEPFDRFWRAEDYHQKYRLRAHRALASEFHAMLPGETAFVDSTAVTRVNGWLEGCGQREQIDRDLPRTGLSQAAQDEVLSHALPRERVFRR
jgi:methionine-S-sulfoxide reductase